MTKSSTAFRTVLSTVEKTLVSTTEQTQVETTEVPTTRTTAVTEPTTSISTVLKTLNVTSMYSTDVIISTEVVTSTLMLPKKRSVHTDLPPLTRSPEELAKVLEGRGHAAQCRPSIYNGKKVPGYASVCHGTNGYFSACRQLGVWEMTTMLRASIV
jgi:hypothetical protein